MYPVRPRDDGVRKMDLVARDARHGEDNLCIDVSIVDATIDSNLMRNGGSAEVRLYAAGVAVKGKETHYRDTPTGYKLVPFIMETHGALSRPAVELVRLLADRIAPRRAGLRGGAVARCRHRHPLAAVAATVATSTWQCSRPSSRTS